MDHSNKVDIHLVSWNRPKMTELVIRTIYRNTDRNEYRLSVWDNSPESTLNMLINLQNEGLVDTIHYEEGNLGLEKARQGLLYMETFGDCFVCVDNDCLPPPDWLPRQLELMQRYENYAAISQRTPVMIGTGNIFEEADKTGMPIVDFPHPGGSFRMMQTKAVQAVEGWDRESEGRGSEERYICGKLRDAGYGTAFATHIQCLHLWGTDNTDNWGYDKSMKPEDSGHSSGVWHPVFDKGDIFEEVAAYTGKELAEEYFR